MDHQWFQNGCNKSHKLRCYTRISGPEKSRNNSREKAFTTLNTSFLSEFSQVMAAKTLKNPYRWQTEGKKTNILTEKPKVAYSVALLLAFLSSENENRQLEDLLLADFGRLPERLLLSVKTNSINENFVTWKLRSLLFCNHDSTHFSILRVSANALYDYYSRIADSFIFIL